VGIVPQYEARRIYKIWRPILDKLEAATGLHFTLRGSPSIPAFESEFIAGAFDFAYMNPYHISPARNRQGYIPLVRDVGRRLQGILVVRKDSPIRSVQQLAGRVVAFPSPNALGASMLIRAELLDKFQLQVIPRYVLSHSSVYLNVILEQTVAGGGVQSTLQQQPDNIKNKLRVLYRTQSIAPHPFAAHPRVAPKIRAQVRQAFLALGQSKEGRQLLARVPIRRIGPSRMMDYEPLSKLKLQRFYQQ